jgi:uncharacterized protein YwqG
VIAELGEPLAAAVGAALDAALEQVPDPVFALVRLGASASHPGLPPQGWVAGRAHVEAALAAGEEPLRTLHLSEPPAVVELDVAGKLDPATAAACAALVARGREASSAAHDEIRALIAEHGHVRGWELQTGYRALESATGELQALRVDVARRVQADGGRPLVVWVPDTGGEGLIEPHSDPDGSRTRAAFWHVTVAAAGAARVEALQEELAPRPKPPPPAAPATRADVREIARAAGLSAEQVERIAASALTGIALHETAQARGTRLGGIPALPPGEPWPSLPDRPLSFLATIALDELPEVEQRALLPADGRLLFFADLRGEGDFGYGEPSNGGHIRVLYVPAGSPAEPREPPPGAERLTELPVLPRAVITVPDAWSLGLTGFDERRYDRVDHAGEAARKDPALANGWSGAHQMLGHPQPVQADPREPGQADPREPGQVLLLQISTDHRLDFSYMDLGAIYFLATPEALQARRWDEVTAEDASC